MLNKERFLVAVNKSSSSKRKYETILYVDGTTSCNCPGWTFKRDGKDRGCKHTVELESKVKQLMVGAAIVKQMRGKKAVQ